MKKQVPNTRKSLILVICHRALCFLFAWLTIYLTYSQISYKSFQYNEIYKINKEYYNQDYLNVSVEQGIESLSDFKDVIPVSQPVSVYDNRINHDTVFSSRFSCLSASEIQKRKVRISGHLPTAENEVLRTSFLATRLQKRYHRSTMEDMEFRFYKDGDENEEAVIFRLAGIVFRGGSPENSLEYDGTYKSKVSWLSDSFIVSPGFFEKYSNNDRLAAVKVESGRDVRRLDENKNVYMYLPHIEFYYGDYTVLQLMEIAAGFFYPVFVILAIILTARSDEYIHHLNLKEEIILSASYLSAGFLLTLIWNLVVKAMIHSYTFCRNMGYAMLIFAGFLMVHWAIIAFFDHDKTPSNHRSKKEKERENPIIEE